jgi:multidrug resistance efflux pump
VVCFTVHEFAREIFAMSSVTLPENENGLGFQAKTAAIDSIETDTIERVPVTERSERPATSATSVVRLLPLAAIALLAGLGVVLWLGQAGEVSLTGFLRAEQSFVYAPRAGRVERVAAKTGDSVKPHQILLVLADDSLDREIVARSREVAALEASLDQCRAKADVQMTLELKSLDEMLHRTRLESAEFLREHYSATFQHVTWRNFAKEASAGRMLAIAPNAMSEPDRVFGALVSDPIVTPEVVRAQAVIRQEEARNSSEVKKASADLCDQHIQELKKLRDNLPEKIRKAAGVGVAEAKLAQTTDQLRSLNQQKSEMTVKASGHGLVGSYVKQPADPVSAGEALVMILDRDQPFVEVDVPSREIKRIKVGQKIRLEFAGEERMGRVEAIAPQAHRRDQTADSWITIRIRPSGKLWPEVPIGSSVSVRLK